MTQQPFHIMHWNLAFDGPWSPEADARYREGGHDGLYLTPGPKESTPRDLDFILALDGLRSLNITSRIQRDEAAFRVLTLEKLVLATGSRRPVLPETRQTAMRQLLLTWRKNLDLAVHWPAVEWFRLDFHPGEDLRWMGQAEDLRHLDLWGRRQRGCLEGIQGCSSLSTLIMTNFAVDATSPMSELTKLRKVRLGSRPPGPPHRLVDLQDLASAALEELWVSDAQVLRGVHTLAGHQRLREVHFTHCPLSEADRRVLAGLPRRVQVRLIDCY